MAISFFETFNFSYDNANRMTGQTNANGSTVTNSYDSANRTTETKHENSIGTTLADYKYSISTKLEAETYNRLTSNFRTNLTDQATECVCRINGSCRVDTSDSLLLWLQSWYLSYCDGDWEHEDGVKITTLDNPGWRVQINLNGTDQESATMEQIKLDNGDDDWVFLWVKNGHFEGAGDPKKLTYILSYFRQFVEEHSSASSSSET